MINIEDEKNDKTCEFDENLRPIKLNEYIGQSSVKEMLEVYISTAIKREESLDHVLLYGPPGLGKTTLAHIIANELESDILVTTGPSLMKPKDLAGILSLIKPGDVLFIDEIHRIPRVVEEMLYSVMEDFVLDIVINKDLSSNILKLELPPFTLVGATTRIGDLTQPLRDRFGIVCSLEYYNNNELGEIINRTSKILNYPITINGCFELASRSRGTPRIANKLFRRIRDFAQFENKIIIDEFICRYALNKLNIDSYGLNNVDRKYLNCIINLFNGGPVGVNAISSAISEEVVTINDVIEPYLLQEGFIKRTLRGRVALEKAYKHLKIKKEN